MLFLANISETYWSAGVMYRLFEQAQNILRAVNYKSNSNKTKEKRTATYPRHNNVISPYTPPETLGDTTPATSQLNRYDPTTLDPISTSWYNDEDLCLNAIEQLLDPDFSLPDDNYDALFSGFDLHGVGQNIQAAGA
jgi:hypothetical protein